MNTIELLDQLPVRRLEQVARVLNGGTPGYDVARTPKRTKDDTEGIVERLVRLYDMDGDGVRIRNAIASTLSDPQQAPQAPPKPAVAAAPKAPIPNDAAARLGALLGEIVAGASAPVDEDTVRRIVQEALAAQPARVVEIVQPDGVRGTVERPMRELEKVVKLVLSGENVALKGPAGCGKTTLGEQVAKAIGAERFCVWSASDDATKGDLFGREQPMTDRWVQAGPLDVFEHGGVCVLGEWDAAPPALVLIMNTALANGFVDVPGRAVASLPTRVVRHPKAYFLADMNTNGHGATAQYAGRNALDGSSLDRFYGLEMTYDTAWERTLATNPDEQSIVAWVQAVRDELERNGSKAIVSSRMIIRALRATRAGIPWPEVKGDLVSMWAKGDRDRALAVRA